jgi:hypothetical protein
VQRAKVDGSWDALMRAKVRSPTPAGWHGFGGRTDRDGPNTNRTDLEDPSASLQNSSARGYPSGWSSGRDFGARSSLGGPRAAIHPYFRVRSAASWPSCTVRLMSDAAAVEYVISGLVVMRHHDRHPAMHHHGLGKLQLTERTLRLLIEPDDREVAAGDYSQVTIGSSLTSEEFGSILFLDFPSSQWTVDFATVQRQDIFRRADGSLDREKLFEYQVHLSVEDFEAGIDARKQFVELAAAGGVQVEDDSDLFERMLAKWRSREVRWDDDLGWPEGGAK